MCVPAVIASGQNSQCTVSLNQPAPAGGISVGLVSSSSTLNGPASVTVTGGASSAIFSIGALAVSSGASAILTATLDGSIQRFAFSVTAPAGPVSTPSVNPGPVISGVPAGVLDAAGYTPDIALGSVFVVKGTRLCPEGLVQAAGYPLTPSLGGVSIAFTPAAGGPTVTPYMIYTYGHSGASQLAAVLPSTAAPGAYLVSVAVNGSSSPAVPVTVVTRKFGLMTADSSGTGLAALQSIDASGTYHYNRFTTGQAQGTPYAPAHPGDFVVAYGTGLGPVQIPDQGAPGVVDFQDTTTVQVLVGGEVITPLYAGRSPAYAGLDQVNFQLPSDVATGCAVTIQVNVGGHLSNMASMSIGAVGGDICSPSPVSTDVLTRLDQGGSLTLGDFWLTQATPAPTAQGATAALITDSAFGGFMRYSGFQLASATAQFAAPGSCQLVNTVGNAWQLILGSSGTFLDAGNLTLKGAGVIGSQFLRDTASGAYALPLGPNPAMSGKYQLSGGGGADVGSFTASVSAGQPVAISGGLPAAIDRSKDLTLSWTGGSAGSLVSVTAISGMITGGPTTGPIYTGARLICTTRADAGSITIPSNFLIRLPKMPDANNGIGYLAVSSLGQPVQGDGMFAAPLTAGGNIDQGFFLGTLGTFTSATYQ